MREASYKNDRLVLTDKDQPSLHQILTLLAGLENKTESVFSLISFRLTDVCSFKVHRWKIKAIFTFSMTSWNKFLDSFQSIFHAIWSTLQHHFVRYFYNVKITECHLHLLHWMWLNPLDNCFPIIRLEMWYITEWSLLRTAFGKAQNLNS